MLRSGWRYVFAAVGLILASTLISHAQPVSRDEGDGPAANQRSPEPQERAQPAFPIAVQDAIDRIARAIEAANDKPESANERERAERDLLAQESMAIWAMWMFWASCAGVVLSSVGVFLIWRTLHHTRIAALAAKDAVEEARAATRAAERGAYETKRIGEAQVHAYISIDRCFATITDDGKSYVKYNIVNTGNVPARELRCKVFSIVLSPSQTCESRIGYTDIVGDLPAKASKERNVKFRGKLSETQIGGIEGRKRTFQIEFEVEFADVVASTNKEFFAFSTFSLEGALIGTNLELSNAWLKHDRRDGNPG